MLKKAIWSWKVQPERHRCVKRLWHTYIYTISINPRKVLLNRIKEAFVAGSQSRVDAPLTLPNRYRQRGSWHLSSFRSSVTVRSPDITCMTATDLSMPWGAAYTEVIDLLQNGVNLICFVTGCDRCLQLHAIRGRIWYSFRRYLCQSPMVRFFFVAEYYVIYCTTTVTDVPP